MTKIPMNQYGVFFMVYYKMKKETHKRASKACYFLCEYEGKIIYTCIFPLKNKKHMRNEFESSETAYF